MSWSTIVTLRGNRLARFEKKKNNEINLRIKFRLLRIYKLAVEFHDKENSKSII